MYFGRVKKQFVHRSTILVAAAVLVFAPGWGGEPTPSSSKTSSELVGRILAPTFDEASAERMGRGAFEKRGSRVKPHGYSSKFVASLSAATSMQPPTQLLLAAVIALALVVSRQLPRFNAQRAPPHLLTP